jgi:hypothetical protein
MRSSNERKRPKANKPAAAVQEGFPRGLAQPALRALAAAGLSSVDQLAGMRAADLAKLHGIGPKAMDLLRADLKRRGKSFRA